MGLKDTVENHPLGVIVLSLIALLTLTTNGLALYSILQPHDYRGSREFANEYILALDSGTLGDIEKKFDSLYAFSTSYHLDKECKPFISPDWIEIARSTQAKGQWIIGLDKMAKQGSFRGQVADLEEFRREAKLFDKSKDCRSELFKQDNACSSRLDGQIREGFKYAFERLCGNEVVPIYYSVSRYSSLYSANLINSSRDGT